MLVLMGATAAHQGKTMGVEASVKLVVGVEITGGDLLRPAASKTRICPRGHLPTGEQKFCSECGGRFELQDTFKAAFALTKLLERWGEQIPEDKDERHDWWLDVLYSRNELHVQRLPDFGTHPRKLVCGVPLAHMIGIIGSGDQTTCVPQGKLTGAFIEAKALVNELGFGDRPLGLFMISSVG